MNAPATPPPSHGKSPALSTDYGSDVSSEELDEIICHAISITVKGAYDATARIAAGIITDVVATYAFKSNGTEIRPFHTAIAWALVFPHAVTTFAFQVNDAENGVFCTALHSSVVQIHTIGSSALSLSSSPVLANATLILATSIFQIASRSSRISLSIWSIPRQDDTRGSIALLLVTQERRPVAKQYAWPY
ncbi:hypothetical protein PTNB73_01045 [Pyrenophora teres f. teres]|uniref:Uncharacterized protein n=2 Tax=Pyrenophora teres f. teres TaxID=97479 RepID=E3RTX5_PYRTT|nr:hypothetical protein PTT_12493 [Pyrenophora teres f. teres 0-1]KAE8842995.1 hypothetical protein HRS9139_02292 [Pyrenophora teres f. teres]KAE8852027.1 hypothetical protein HRS9122_02314 [Pyrenophora teres f. teres]KAE8870697.1 hypothetical protein PTNB29_01041 [Pyrenophora teres f. teres]KAE8874413.1 hypothetical protein PTNB73_01045 [Pyrenophora teres f. teres]